MAELLAFGLPALKRAFFFLETNLMGGVTDFSTSIVHGILFVVVGDLLWCFGLLWLNGWPLVCRH